MPSCDSLRVCVVEDETNHALPLVVALERANYEVLLFSNAELLLESPMLSRAGCIVADIELPGISGLELQSQLQRRNIQAPFVVVSGHAAVSDTIRAFELGARAFFEKPFNMEKIVEVIAKAVTAESKRRLAASERATRLAALTQRELEVLAQLVAGKSVKEIARQLGISPSTAEKHRANVLQKTGFDNLIDLTRFMFAGAQSNCEMENFAIRFDISLSSAPNAPHRSLPGVRKNQPMTTV